MANATPDFVQVQLSSRGQQLAGSHPLTVSNGRRSFTFTGTEAQKVEISYEWRTWLSKVHAPDGTLLFELAPVPAPAAVAAATTLTPAETAPKPSTPVSGATQAAAATPASTPATAAK